MTNPKIEKMFTVCKEKKNNFCPFENVSPYCDEMGNDGSCQRDVEFIDKGKPFGTVAGIPLVILPPRDA